MSTSKTTPAIQATTPDTTTGGRRGHRRFTRAAVLAATLAGASAALLSTAGFAGATVNTNPFPGQYAQPSAGSIIYSFSNTDSGSAGTLLEDNGNAMTNGATVDTWAPYYFDNAGGSAGSGSILQANEQWAFVPVAANAGGSLLTGYGELVNRQSGLCLDINGSDPNEYGDGATVDQWACGGGPNQEWTATPNPYGSGYEVTAALAGTYNGNYDGAYLGNNNEYCQPLENNNGDPIVTRASGDNPCTNWNIQRVSYEFATNQWSVAQGALTGTTDTQEYNCISGYTMRLNPNPNANGLTNYYAYTNLSNSGVKVTEDTPGDTQGGPAQPEYYQADNGHEYLNGQVAFYCDPNTTSP
jgi:hypothetical protein